MTTPVTVTVENGDLVSVKRTNAAVNSENLKLVGSILVVATNKVLEFSGNVQLKDSQNVIGTFHYNNNDSTMTAPVPAGMYESVVRITNEAYADKQVEATEALLAGIKKWSEGTINTLCE